MEPRTRMTEDEWEVCADPIPLLEYLGGIRDGALRHAPHAGAEINRNLHRLGRKLRLFTCGCCRRVWHLLADPRSRTAVEVAERYADGLADQAELRAAHKAAN